MTDSTMSSKIQSGSKTIKEKISSIFKFKKTPSSLKKPNETKLAKDKAKNNNNTQQEKRKVFNIQLSEEDKENVYDINDDDDDEDEYEEEGGEGEEEQQLPKNQPIKDNTANNVLTDSKKEELTSSQTNTDNRGEKGDYDERPNDINMICHYLYPKGSVIDINDVDIHRFIKIKQAKKGMLSIFGFGNKKQAPECEVNYLAFFDENYLYFMKDIEYDPNNKSNRLIGNRYNLLTMYNAFFDQFNNNRWKIRLEFASSTDNNADKVMIFNKESADRFYDTLNVYFKRLNMKMEDSELHQQQANSSSS